MKIIFDKDYNVSLSQCEIILRDDHKEKVIFENLKIISADLYIMRITHGSGEKEDFNISNNEFFFDVNKFSSSELLKLCFMAVSLTENSEGTANVKKSNVVEIRIEIENDKNISNKAIFLSGVQKKYKLYDKKSEKYLDFFLWKSFGSDFFALNEISFSVDKGDSLGLIGLNGSGKSTLANIIAGCSEQSKGTVKVNGSVSAISISSAIDIRLTGIENITQKCLLLGLKHSEIKKLMPSIIEFSELGPFINQQVKTYSSGMRAKLGFAISVNIDPDIIIIDEALSVGDPTFTSKCLDKMNEFRKAGKTIVFVSHSLSQVNDFCNKAIWLEGGRIKAYGDCREVTDQYSNFLSRFNKLSKEEQINYKEKIRSNQTEKKR